jgi:UDP-glucose 4-epimerase
LRALITGGAGFIGSHLAEALLKAGHRVAVLDDLSTGRFENIAHLQGRPGFTYTIDSVTNDAVVGALIAQSDVVFHLAAAVGVKLVVQAPVLTIETNVHGTETVLRHARHGRKLVVVASTSEVYGKGVKLPFSEDLDLVLGGPSKTRWGYATSKLLDEFLAMAYWKQYETPVIVVRLFNTVGPRQSSRYGMVLPNFVKWALDDAPITIHGDGTHTRSFTWVGDVESALLALVQEPKAVGEVFNIGNGAEVSIRELAERVKARTESRSPLRYIPYTHAFDANFEDMPRRVPDISKIRRFVGYQPTVHLDEIIDHVIAFWRKEEPRLVSPDMLALDPIITVPEQVGFKSVRF